MTAACQAGIGAGGHSRWKVTVVSVSCTSSGGVTSAASAGGEMTGSTTATWVMSAKFS